MSNTTTVNPTINITLPNQPMPPTSSPPAARPMFERQESLDRYALITHFLKQFDLRTEDHNEILHKLTGVGAGVRRG